MGLVITRTIGTGWYGGNNLDTKRPEQTYTHKVWVHGINKRSQKVIIYIEDKKGEEVQLLKVGNILVLDDCIVHLLEIGSFYEDGKKCVHGKFKILAPEEYIIIRNNAKKRTGRVIDIKDYDKQLCQPPTEEHASSNH